MQMNSTTYSPAQTQLPMPQPVPVTQTQSYQEKAQAATETRPATPKINVGKVDLFKKKDDGGGGDGDGEGDGFFKNLGANMADMGKQALNGLATAGVGMLADMGINAAMSFISSTGGMADTSQGLGGVNDTLNGLASQGLGLGYLAGRTEKYEVSGDLANSSSYGGTKADAQTAAGNAGKKLLFGRRKANRMIREARRKDQMVQNIMSDARDDKAAAETGARINSLRNQIEAQGGLQTQQVKKGGVIVDKSFLDKCHKYQDGGKVTKRPHKDMSQIEFFDYLKATNRWSNDYDYEDFYDSFEDFNEWVEEEQKGMSHFPDKYKKPNHITFSTESDYDSDETPGGKWTHKGDQWYFTPSQYMIDQFGGKERYSKLFHDYVDDGSILVFQEGGSVQAAAMPIDFVERMEVQNGTKNSVDDTTNKTTKEKDKADKKNANTKVDPSKALQQSTGMFYMKRGGKINIIPSGKLHKERHRLENELENMGSVSKKGIPVVTTNSVGEIRQQAEIERDEIILNNELSRKIIELMGVGTDEAMIEAGRLLSDEVMENTEDNTGLLKKVKP